MKSRHILWLTEKAISTHGKDNMGDELFISEEKLVNIKRIQLMPETEVIDLYARPEFNNEEQKTYLSLNESERIALDQYVYVKARAYFILQLGYFKAKQQFFKFTFEDVQSDVDFIIKTYFSEHDVPLTGCLARVTIHAQRAQILALFNYNDWSPEYEPLIKFHVCKLLRYYPKCHSALRQLLGYLEQQQIVIPSYRTLQDIFSEAFRAEEDRLNLILLIVPANHQEQLTALIGQDDGIGKFNIIRTDQKDFQFTATRAEVDKALELSALYEFSKEFIPKLGLSKNAIRYYADVAEQYATFRLRNLSKPQQLLHLICFIYHRYQQIIDNLITSFIYHTRSIMDAGKTYAEIAMMEHSSRLVIDFPKLAEFLKWFPDRDHRLTHEELNQEAYNILPEEQFTALAEFLNGNTFDKKAATWEFYLKSCRMFALYLRPIVLTVPFEFYKKDSEIIELIDILKTYYVSGKSPTAFRFHDDLGLTIPKNMIKYLKGKPTDTKINPYLFEFYVYQKIYHQLDRGKLFCNDSVSYCDLDHDLIDEALVDDIDKIAQEFGYPKIPIYCDKRLDDALKALDDAWDRTTENIRLHRNTGLKRKEMLKPGQEDWGLLYDSSEKLDDAFFRTLPKMEIADVMMFIGDLIGMWEGFTHMKDRYTKRKEPVALALNACVLSEAFGCGTMKMAEMSDLVHGLLRATGEDFIRIETLCAANDIVSNHIHSLPVFNLWNLLENKLLADADGQKHATSDSTIQSRFSRKYIGKGKGISIYTLVANFVAINAKNIGLNEYEGHSLFDMIYNNKTDVDINMVTGDNHSLNKLNFVALDSIGVDYVPSIKNVREAADDLYSVKSPKSYTGILLPKGKINVDKITSEKRGILRVLLSLIMQENTQSNIIRKLNSHSRYARLKVALFEYNKILKSTHVLNLIDNMKLRKAIRTARNRTEAYHQLQGVIRKIYSGVFKGKKIADNRVSAHASRLVANCIIAYNSIILNAVYQKMLKESVDEDVIDEFARISPIAWVHLLFTGRYSFKKSNGEIDVAAMAKTMEKHLKQNLWSVDS